MPAAPRGVLLANACGGGSVGCGEITLSVAPVGSGIVMHSRARVPLGRCLRGGSPTEGHSNGNSSQH